MKRTLVLMASPKWLRSDPIAFLHISQVKPEGARTVHTTIGSAARRRIAESRRIGGDKILPGGRIPDIEGQVHEDAGHGDVHPDREGDSCPALVILEPFPAGEEDRPESERHDRDGQD